MAGIGDSLRQAREAAGLDLRQAAQETRISIRFLAALEEEQFDLLPAAVYVRGFLRSYASYLGLDGQDLIGRLPPEFGTSATAPRVSYVPGPTRPSRDPWAARPAAPSAPGVRQGEAPDEVPEEPLVPKASFPGTRTVGRRRRELPPPEAPGAAAGRTQPMLIDDVTAVEGSTAVPGLDEWLPPEDLPLEDEPRRPWGPPPGEQSRLRGYLVLALAAVVVIGIAGALFLLLSDGGDGQQAVSPLATSTPAQRTPTIVPPQGTPGTTGTPGVRQTPSPGASGTPSVTPTTTPGTPSPTQPGAPTAVGTATPEPGATATAVPTATATSPPPTPVPPTAVPTPVPPPPTVVPHPSRFGECLGGICGGAEVRIVCAPDGWFVDRPDVGGVFPAEQYGWRVVFGPARDGEALCGG